MARPRLTPSVHDRIIRAVRATGHYADAARSAGVDPGTFRRWRTIGERVLLPPDHQDALTDPDAHEKACARLYAAVVTAEGEWATEARGRIILAGTKPNTVRVTVRRQVIDPKTHEIVTLEESREEERPPDWRALGYVLDRHSPPKTHVEITGAEGGPVVVSLAERAAAARSTLAALRAEPPAEHEAYEA